MVFDRRAYQAEWMAAKYAENPDVYRKRSARWRAANVEKSIERSRIWRESNKARVAEYNAKYRSENVEKRRLLNANWYAKNVEKRKIYNTQWRAEESPAERRIKQAAWRALNPDKVRALQARHYLLNPKKYTARVAARKARQLRATPAWANHFFIEEAYDLAQLRTKATGFKWHVDHVVPLISKRVCGLHVENNLQVIPATTNASKGNRHWPDMPSEMRI